MSKLDLNWVLAYKTFWDQVSVPTAYREYFAHYKKEILAPDKKNKDIYYVFRNVNRPVSCGWLLCNEGDGYLDKTFSNYTDAVKYITGEKKKPKKTITIVEDDKETEVPSDDDMIEKLSKLAEDYQSGKITEEEFKSKKTEILK